MMMHSSKPLYPDLPADYPMICVVCGHGYRLLDKHECPKSVLAGLKAAERRAREEEDPESDAVPGDRARSYGERLEEGFAMMRDCN